MGSRARHDEQSIPAGTRPVGGISLLALGLNGIVGVGIFFVPGQLAAHAPGAGSVAVFAGTALALAPLALTFAVLGRRFVVDGGPVVFARAAFGELVSFLVGWVAFVSAVASCSATVAGFVASILQLFEWESGAAMRLGTGLYVTALALACCAGITVSARTWTLLTVLKLIPLVALLGAYLAAGAPGTALTWPAQADWLPAALTATFALQGFEIVPVIAGQVRAPARAVPAATLASLGLAALLYVGLQSACVAALPGLAGSTAPLADAAGVYGGPVFAAVVQVGTSVSALGITFGMMVTTPRYLSALAEGGSLGVGLAHMNARGVPVRALLATWLLVSVLLQISEREELFSLSATAVLMQLVSAAVALGVLALRRERGLRPAHLAVAVPAAVLGLAIVWSGATGRELGTAAAAVALGLVLREALRPRPGAAR